MSWKRGGESHQGFFQLCTRFWRWSRVSLMPLGLGMFDSSQCQSSSPWMWFARPTTLARRSEFAIVSSETPRNRVTVKNSKWWFPRHAHRYLDLSFHQMNVCPKKDCANLPCTRFLYIMASNSQVDFGENYVQELLDKAAELPNSIRSDDVGWGPHLDLHIRTHHRADRVHDSVFDSQPGFEPE